MRRYGWVWFLMSVVSCGTNGATDKSGSNTNVNPGINNVNSSINVVLTREFRRYAGNPVFDPDLAVSPTTQMKTMAAVPDPCAVWDPKAQVWRAYFTFLDPVAEVTEGADSAGIAGAVSVDGTDFVVNDTLALRQIGTFDSGSVETCDVVVLDDPDSPTGQRFYMYYSGNRENFAGESGQFLIALAMSNDGVTFTPIDAAKSPLGEEGVLFGVTESLGGEQAEGNFITDPAVVVLDGEFHMWTLCIVGQPEPFGGICYHSSRDGVNWTHHGLVTGLDRAFPIQPTVFYNSETGLFEMYVVMDNIEEEAAIQDPATNLGLRVRGFWHATSTDGITWTQTGEDAEFIEDLSFGSEDKGLATGPDAELKDGVVYLFYASFTSKGDSGVGTLLNWPLNLARRLADR